MHQRNDAMMVQSRHGRAAVIAAGMRASRRFSVAPDGVLAALARSGTPGISIGRRTDGSTGEYTGCTNSPGTKLSTDLTSTVADIVEDHRWREEGGAGPPLPPFMKRSDGTSRPERITSGPLFPLTLFDPPQPVPRLTGSSDSFTMAIR